MTTNLNMQFIVDNLMHFSYAEALEKMRNCREGWETVIEYYISKYNYDTYLEDLLNNFPLSRNRFWKIIDDAMIQSLKLKKIGFCKILTKKGASLGSKFFEILLTDEYDQFITQIVNTFNIPPEFMRKIEVYELEKIERLRKETESELINKNTVDTFLFNLIQSSNLEEIRDFAIDNNLEQCRAYFLERDRRV